MCAQVGGFYLANIPAWISWLKYLSFAYFGYNLVRPLFLVSLLKHK